FPSDWKKRSTSRCDLRRGMTRPYYYLAATADDQAAPLSRCHLHLVVSVDEIVAGLRLVALEATVEIGARVDRLVGAEDLVLPVPIALRLRILAAPPGLLLHDRIALNSVRLDEAAVGVLGRITLGIELGGILHRCDHCAGRKRRPLLGRVNGSLTGVILA